MWLWIKDISLRCYDIYLFDEVTNHINQCKTLSQKLLHWTLSLFFLGHDKNTTLFYLILDINNNIARYINNGYKQCWMLSLWVVKIWSLKLMSWINTVINRALLNIKPLQSRENSFMFLFVSLNRSFIIDNNNRTHA